MDNQIFNINPEPIALFTLPQEKHYRYKKEIQLIFENAPEHLNQKFRHEPYSEHICNGVNQNIFNSFPELKELKSDINNILITYIQEIGFLCKEFVINSAWLNKSNKNATLTMHHHANSYISGNYFVNFDPTKHSSLIFQNDRRKGTNYRQTIEIPPTPSNSTTYNIDGCSLPAKEGQILIWRSNLNHGYMSPNKSDNRYTLSFNAMPKTLSTGAYTFTVSE
jgi:uncharacterized protein (TIGR02466 family)